MIRALRNVVANLVGLVADDPVLVIGTAIALGATAWLTKGAGVENVVGGILLFVLVWASLFASLRRFRVELENRQ